jgi:hypothetical protein
MCEYFDCILDVPEVCRKKVSRARASLYKGQKRLVVAQLGCRGEVGLSVIRDRGAVSPTLKPGTSDHPRKSWQTRGHSVCYCL